MNEDILRQIKNLKNGKTLGSTQISAEIIKAGGKQLHVNIFIDVGFRYNRVVRKFMR